MNIVVEKWQLNGNGNDVRHCENCATRMEKGDSVASVVPSVKSSVYGFNLCGKCARELADGLSKESGGVRVCVMLRSNRAVYCDNVEQEVFDLALEMFFSERNFSLRDGDMEMMFNHRDVAYVQSSKRDEA